MTKAQAERTEQGEELLLALPVLSAASHLDFLWRQKQWGEATDAEIAVAIQALSDALEVHRKGKAAHFEKWDDFGERMALGGFVKLVKNGETVWERPA